jgi:hypothetical protein
LASLAPLSAIGHPPSVSFQGQNRELAARLDLG